MAALPQPVRPKKKYPPMTITSKKRRPRPRKRPSSSIMIPKRPPPPPPPELKPPPPPPPESSPLLLSGSWGSSTIRIGGIGEFFDYPKIRKIYAICACYGMLYTGLSPDVSAL